MNNGIKILVGSCAVYAAMAACSGAGGIGGPSTNASGGESPLGTGGQSTGGAPPSVAGMTAATTGGAGLMNPVPTASAEQPPASSFEEACDKVGSGAAATYAEHLFPGKSLNDLASVVVLVQATQVPGYEWLRAGIVQVKDGAVAVACATRARFIVP